MLADLTQRTQILGQLQAWLAGHTRLPAGTTVFADEPDPAAVTPFIVLTGHLIPDRVALDGSWPTGVFRLAGHSVHDSIAQAHTLADIVRGILLEDLPDQPGVLDVQPDAGPVGERIAGVPQVLESWLVPMTRVA